MLVLLLRRGCWFCVHGVVVCDVLPPHYARENFCVVYRLFFCTGLTIHDEVAEEGYHRLLAGVRRGNTLSKSKVASACTERTS